MRKFFIYFIVTSILFTSGCHTLRKKFIRKKRYKKETPVYVDFKDYPAKPSRQAYIDYYLFVRGWLDELAESLKRGLSFKREKRAISQALMNFEQMLSFYDLEGKKKIYPLYEELLAIKKEIEKNPNTNEVKRNFLIRKIEYFKRRFEKDCNYTDIEGWIS